MSTENNIKQIKCPTCGNLKEFDLTKIPVGVKFDYKCEKCGTIHMIKL